ncbi:hypothetical protein QFC19_002524 [Naganishia cerealis]|uniref:Uncharacterized protein n=1 Tax=Naganishia cerealis TaxID=610337 RepID=A0ACC2WA47_9TREE|nr:hypothetical protein QFC19_002524 [Naganishia cerealis]
MRSMQSARSRRDGDVEDIEEEGETTENDFREELDRDVSQGAEHDVDSQSSAQSPSASGARTSPSNRRDRSASIISSTSIQERGWGEAPTYEDAVRHTPQLGSSLRMSEDMHRGSQDTSMAADISRVQTSDSAQIPLTASARDSTTTGTAGGFRSFVSRLTGRVPVSSGTAGRYTGVHPSPGDAENGQGVGWGEAEGPSEAYAMTGRPRGFSSASGQSQLTVDTAAPRPSISSGMQRFRSNTGASTNNSLVSLLLHPTMSNQSDANAASSARFHFRSRSASNALSLPPDPSSPSASVVNLGISPPLPGSVIRSAYIPPRAGFSTEQLKFLSSTESLGKYGASFGPNEAAMGFGPSSEAYSTRSRSGSASSTGPMDRSYNLHTRGQSIGSATYMGDMSTDGLPTFDELLREEAAADEIRRGSGIQAGNTVHPEEEAVVQETPTVVEIPAQSSPSPVVAQTELRPPTQLPTLSISRISPSFDLEVVPPTPMIEESRRSLIIEP